MHSSPLQEGMTVGETRRSDRQSQGVEPCEMCGGEYSKSRVLLLYLVLNLEGSLFGGSTGRVAGIHIVLTNAVFRTSTAQP